jgi:hypothetical protein
VFNAAQRLQYFVDRAKRGTVCRWWEVDFAKPKYAVMLNATWPPERDVIFVFTTTQGEFYTSKRFEADIIRIPPGKYSFLPDPDETILNFRQFYQRECRAVCGHRDFTIEGDIDDPDDLRDINSLLRHSDRIAPEHRELILPGVS